MFKNKDKILEYFHQKREIILIDHNKLDKNQNYLKEFVTEIIDHHVDSDTDMKYKNLIKKSLIYPLGSCSTLILLDNIPLLKKYLITENKNNEINNFFKNSFRDFLIFISAVLVDTRNFLKSDFIIRWNNLDLLAYQQVIEINEKFFDQNNNEENDTNNTDRFYEKLINSKYDEEANLNLGIRKLLNKDKKDFNYSGKFGIFWSSLQVSIEKIISKFSLEELKKEAFLNIENKDIYVFNYREKEENNTFTYISFLFNKKFLEEKIQLSTFCEKLNEFLNEKLKEKYYKVFIIDENYCKIKLNDSITRKNFEPYLNEFINKFYL